MKIKSIGILLFLIIALTVRPKAQITVIQDIQCNGDSNGVLTASSIWLIPPVHFVWSNGDTTSAIHDLPAGNYWVILTDDWAGWDSYSLDLYEPTPLTVAINSVTASSCDGYNDGGATITTGGGITPYSYSWREIVYDSIYSTQNLVNVRGGTYELTVTDDWGCTVMDTIVIGNGYVVGVTDTVDTYVCNGSLGSVTLQADFAGPGSYYTYDWNSTFNSGSFVSNDSIFGISTSFLPGTYYITTTENSSGCLSYFSFTISQSATPMVAAPSVTHNVCYSEMNGNIQLIVSGGDPLPFYQCIWTGPNGFSANGLVISGLGVGDYYYTVSDDSACSVSAMVRIEPVTPLQGYVARSDASCFGYSDGMAWTIFSGGTGIYSYLWSNGDTLPQISNLIAGNYNVTVTDSAGCFIADTVIIGEPPAIVLSLDSVIDASCYGYSDGQIWTTVSGGAGGLQYSWTLNGIVFPQLTEDIINLPAGIYAQSASDSLGCSSVLIMVVNEPFPTLFNDSSMDVTCNSGVDGYWSIEPVGPDSPYIAIFSSGDTISSDTMPVMAVNTLTAGSYQCVVTGSNGCQYFFNVVLNEPYPITVGFADIVPVACAGGTTGSVTIGGITGGTGSYTYLWNPTGSIVNSISGVASGIYTVTITDAVGCSLVRIYQVDGNAEPIIFYPTITNTSCQQKDDGAVTLYATDISGLPFINSFILYDSLGALIDSVATGVPIENLQSGLYVGVLVNSYGCTAVDSIQVEKGGGDCIIIPNMVTANGDNYNDFFRVQGGCDYDEFLVVIFNDLGKKVYDSDDCAFTWDPVDAVNAATNTVFYYYILAKEGDKEYEFRNSINVNY